MWFTCEPKPSRPRMTVEACRRVSQGEFRIKEMLAGFDPAKDPCFGCTYWHKYLPSKKRVRKAPRRRRSI